MRLSRPQNQSAAGMKNSDDIIWNRTRGIPACSAVSQPTALPHVPQCMYINAQIYMAWFVLMLLFLIENDTKRDEGKITGKKKLFRV